MLIQLLFTERLFWTCLAYQRSYLILFYFFIGFVVRRVSRQNDNFRKRLLIIGMMISLSIETLQMITGKGYFEVADIINNTIGFVLDGLFSSKTLNTIEGD